MTNVEEQKLMLEAAINEAEENILNFKKIITKSKAKLRKLERIEKELIDIFSDESDDAFNDIIEENENPYAPAIM